MIYIAPIIDRTLEPRVTQSLACAPAGSADVVTDPLSWSTVSRPLFDANQANELHGYISTEPQEVASADHSNQQYSITAVTTSTGAIAERYAYSTYGEPTICDASGSVLASSAINNRYSYTGREWDSTVGLYHFRARWMSPKTGRFLTRDPIGYEDGLGLYSYLGGRSLIAVDPTGLSSIEVKINAFISNKHDSDGDGWIPLFPTRMFWWFVGTDRRMGGEPGTSRLSKTMSISSCQVGKGPPSDNPATGSGTKFGVAQATCGGLCWYNVVQTDFRVGPVFENDGVGVKPDCNSYWSGQFWGNMPFLYRVSPNIDVDGKVDFNAGADQVFVSVSLTTSAFPDFEVLATADGTPCAGSPFVQYSTYTHPAWGLSYLSWSTKQKIKGTFVCPGKTQCKCGGTCK
jgi:RHS repeat-associated protein